MSTASAARMRIFAVTVFFFAVSHLPAAPAAPPGDEIYLWTLDVLFGSEFEKNFNQVRRWIFSPSLSVYSRNPEHHRLVREIVSRLNHVLAGTPIQRIRHFAFEEITQSLGLPGDSMRFRDSLFYSGDFEKGDPVTITDRDARLVRLLYQNIRDGASRKRVIEAVTDHWQEIP